MEAKRVGKETKREAGQRALRGDDRFAWDNWARSESNERCPGKREGKR